MKPISLFFLLLKIFVLTLFLSPFLSNALALDEVFEIYDAPQGLAMGNAFTADASGYSANYYNPAGLAKATKKNWEIVPIALELMPSLNGLGHNLALKSAAIAQVAGRMQTHPNSYYYHRANFVPAVSKRGVGMALLFSQQLAGISNGTNFDMNATTDIVPTLGGAINLAGNLLKIGIAGKLIFRQQLKGEFAHTAISTAAAVDALSKEGMGAGADIGMMFTLPNKYLPTVGIAWRDMFGTSFFGASHLFQSYGNGRPDRIPQSFNAAFSIHPNLSRVIKSTWSFEYKHIERSDLALRKKIHFGVQIDTGKIFYLWGGMNQLYWTGGAGLRVTGGNLEVGSYGTEVGTGDATWGKPETVSPVHHRLLKNCFKDETTQSNSRFPLHDREREALACSLRGHPSPGDGKRLHRLGRRRQHALV